MMGTLTKSIVKNVDFKVIDKDLEDFDKVNSKNVDFNAFDMDHEDFDKI